MFKNFNKKIDIKICQGQSIVEMIIAIAIFSLVASSITMMVLGSFSALMQGGEQTEAKALVQEGIEAVRAIKDRAWNENIYSTSSVSVNANQWVFDGEGLTETIGKFTRVISFDDVCRDNSDDIVDCPGSYIDVQSKKASVVVSWDVRPSVQNIVERVSYITNWDSSEWIQTDWSGGSGQSIWSDETKYSSDDGNVDFTTNGEIKLNNLGGCAGKIWPFNNALIYTYDNNKIEVVSGTAQLKSLGGGPIDGFTQGMWHLDEAGGTIIDYSGNGNDLTNVKGLPQYGQSGKFATALAFNGNSSRYINSGQQVGLGITGAITIDAWIYRTAAAVVEEAIISKWRELGNKKSYALSINTDNNLEFRLSGDGSAEVSVTALNTVPLDTWVYVAGVYDGNNIYVFQNGVLENSVTYNGGIANQAAFVGVSGADTFAGGDAFFNGKIDEVRISNTARWITDFTPPIGPFGPDSYYTDDPIINPINSHTVSGLGVWSTFTETATKNGGEIYYQLSDDGGTVWKYWDGAIWVNAGATDYNTAIVINTNIEDFPVATEQIMFKAFFSSDGNQQVILDDIEVTCAKQKYWDFSNSGDYTYDSSKITVTGGLASLADLGGGSCSGTPTTCGVFGTQLTCDAQGGCAWNAGATGLTVNPEFSTTLNPWTTGTWGSINPTLSLSTLGGNPGGYANIQFPNTKNRTSGGYFEQSFTTTEVASVATVDLDWIVNQYAGIADSLTLYAFMDSSSGTPTIGQEVWSSGNQTGTGSWSNVSNIDVSSKITGAGTYYLKVTAYVDYVNGGANRSYAVGFDNVVLDWATESSCLGTPTACDVFVGESSCLLQGGCLWAGVTLYPSDNPPINPTVTYTGSNIDVWSTFTETATKNGGEIYYQLSDDGGTVWKYWDGAGWGNASSTTDYNTASVVNANIETFPVATEQIMFKAFLSGDGSQEVILDNIEIGWGGVGGGGFSVSGSFISSSFNTGNISPVQAIDWDEVLPTIMEDIKIEISTAPDSGGVPGVWGGWYGSGGLGTFFTNATGTLISTDLNNDQWIRYRASLTGDGSDTPVLKEIRINYK